MLFTPIMLHFYEPSGAKIKLKTAITSVVASKKLADAQEPELQGRKDSLFHLLRWRRK